LYRTAIILAPERVSGSNDISGRCFDRRDHPANVEDSRSDSFHHRRHWAKLCLTGNAIAPPFVSRIGTPFGGNGNFGAASNFPGYGIGRWQHSAGIVLATTVLPCTALTGNCNPPANASPQSQVIVPTVFTISPSYLPDAPFINRLYGESSFTDMVVGAKIRLSGPNNALDTVHSFLSLVSRQADDFKGFNQLQRGASAGGNLGDLV